MAAMKGSWSFFLVCVLLWLSVVPADGFLRHLCFNPLGFARVDPIVSFGKPSTHVHHLHGGSNLGLESTDANFLLASNCTSCSITTDKSTYWAPAMYFEHENGTFSLLSTASAITIYYKLEKRANHQSEKYAVFPKGFRMVAGTNEKRSWVGPWPVPEQSTWGPEDTTQEALAEKAIGFNCLNYNGASAEPSLAFPYIRDKVFTDAHCADGLRAELLFPSCWDGVNLDSTDHKSHVVYPKLIQDGSCPQTHPIYLPILFYETIWNTQEFTGLPGQYIFANGDPTGFGYHGDFIAAWEDGVLQRMTDDPTCTDHDLDNRYTNGIQEYCLAVRDAIQSPAEAAKCKLEVPEVLKDEKVDGLLNGLPNNLKVVGSRHNPGEEPINVAGPQDRTSSSPADDAVATTSTAVAPSSLKAPPTKTTEVHEQAPSLIILSTSIYTENNIKYEVVMAETVVTETVTITSATPMPARRRHIHSHGHSHRHV